MLPKRFQDPKTGFQLLSSMHAKKHLKKIGLEREDYLFWKQVGKALLCTYTIMGAIWLYNGNSPLGWWTPKPPPKEEQELANMCDCRQFPDPGYLESLKEFISKGVKIGTTIGPKGMVEDDKDVQNQQKEPESKKFDHEAQKIWSRMRNEVVAELKEKGFDVK